MINVGLMVYWMIVGDFRFVKKRVVGRIVEKRREEGRERGVRIRVGRMMVLMWWWMRDVGE